jgi:S-formylglutathione hydrolase
MAESTGTVPVTLETLSTAKSFGGVQGVYRHQSRATRTPMTFSVFIPPQPGRRPVVWYLSGLTCTHANVTEKGQFQRVCAELGLIFVAPDTSPRGEGVPDDPEGAYDFGLGAGFYLNATEAPWAANYRMESYVVSELADLVAANFPADMDRQAVTGHSMGGHGALTLALKHPGRWNSVSAFAPIASPMRCPWGERALAGYLGNDRQAWRRHDATALLEDGARLDALLVDQGEADPFLESQLKPELLETACRAAGVPLTLRRQPGYDHSYYFVSTFMEDHLRWHAERLR